MKKNKKRKDKRSIIYKCVSLKDELLAVKGRLENDVYPYFELIETRNKNQVDSNKIGFWASGRLLFPIIEHTARIFYKGNNNREKTMDLLRVLGISHPNIYWEMFRHALTHTDYIPMIIVGRVMIYSMINNTGSFIKVFSRKNPNPRLRATNLIANYQILVYLDTRDLYERLIHFLTNEIESVDNRKTRIDRVIRYKKNDKRNRILVEELNDIIGFS